MKNNYSPDPKNRFALYGAKYIYGNAVISAGTLGVRSDGKVLRFFEDGFAECSANCKIPHTTGISLSAAGLSASATPFVSVVHKGDFGAGIAYINEEVENVSLSVSAGGSFGEYSVSYVTLPTEEKDAIVQLLLVPGDVPSFELFAISFFASEDERGSFDFSEYNDYFENYSLGGSFKFEKLTDAEDAEFVKLIKDRIHEIRYSADAVTPADIKGKCYYISSLRGDDANDGLSPDTPWRSPSKLQVWHDDGSWEEVAHEGDGVFFERGSEFYPEIYNNACKTVLLVNSGVTYGAYGVGEKPALYGALDFGGGNGRWTKTEWENVWELDPEQIDARPEFRSYKCDIGNIIIDGGRYTGVKITPYEDYHKNGKEPTDDDYAPFGVGKKTLNVGFVSNGLSYFTVGERPCENPGTALKNNLEFLHDRKEGRLYLYWDGETSPADAFDDIKVSKNAPPLHCSTGPRPLWDFHSLWVDNLTFKYSTDYLLRLEGRDLKMTNCIIGYSNKSVSTVASGVEVAGNVDGWIIDNCFFHDVGDGPLSSQGCEGAHGAGLRWENNVITTSGCGVEIWHTGLEKGSYQKDVSVRNNILAYIGAGLIQSGNYGFLQGASVLNGYWLGCNPTDCYLENNLIYKPNGEIFNAYVATKNNSHGWHVNGNTYVANPAYVTMMQNYETFDKKSGGYSMNAVTRLPYSERYLAHLTSLGIDSDGRFLYYEGNDSARAGEFYYKFKFLTGYYAEFPETPLIVNPK